MNNLNQVLNEELNKIQYILNYKRGVVISEQGQLTPKQKEASDAGWGPVTDEYAKKLPVGPDGKILPNKTKSTTKTAPSTNVKPTIRQLIEKDINNEKLWLTWTQVKERFGSSGQASDNQLLYKAWKSGWRPGQEVPVQYQTPTYKQKNTKMASIDMKPIKPGQISSGITNNQNVQPPSQVVDNKPDDNVPNNTTTKTTNPSSPNNPVGVKPEFENIIKRMILQSDKDKTTDAFCKAETGYDICLRKQNGDREMVRKKIDHDGAILETNGYVKIKESDIRQQDINTEIYILSSIWKKS
jgi:hypothetical protein